MLSQLRAHEQGLPVTMDNLLGTFFGGDPEKTTFSENEVTHFAVQGAFLALLEGAELTLWDHTKKVVLWTHNVNLDDETRYDETLKFMGHSLVYSAYGRHHVPLLVFNLEGIQETSLLFPLCYRALSKARILCSDQSSQVSSYDLNGEKERDYPIEPLGKGDIDLFETDSSVCAHQKNTVSITDKTTSTTKKIEFHKDPASFASRPLEGSRFAFYKVPRTKAGPSSCSIIDLQHGKIVSSDAYPESDSISDLIYHKGWTYVADRVGSLIAYHSTGMTRILVEKKVIEKERRKLKKGKEEIIIEEEVLKKCSITTTLSIDNNFLMSHSYDSYANEGTIKIWSTLTQKLLKTYPSSRGLALLIHGKIFSNTANGFEVFELYNSTS